jgi:hypothetical protein
MVYVRLTQDDRDSVRKAAMIHGFGPKFRAEFEKRPAIFQEFYRSLFNDEEWEVLNGMEPGWLPSSSRIHFDIDGERFKLGGTAYHSSDNMHHGMARLCDPEFRHCDGSFEFPLPYKMFDRKAVSISSSRAKGANKKVVDHFKALEELDAEAKRVNDNARMILGGCKSYKQLLEAWPEVKPFCNFLEARAKGKAGTPPANLPAIPMAALNEKLELPV